MHFENLVNTEDTARFLGVKNKELESVEEVVSNMKDYIKYNDCYNYNRTPFFLSAQCFNFEYFYKLFGLMMDNETGELKIDSYLNHITNSIKVADIKKYKVKNNREEIFLLSYILSHYFVYENYNKFNEELIEFLKNHKDIQNIIPCTNFENSAIKARILLCLIYSSLKAGAIQCAKKLKSNYIRYIKETASKNSEVFENNFFNNKYILYMHTYIMKKLYEEKSQNIEYFGSCEIYNPNGSSLETNPEYIIDILDMFMSKSYRSPINSRNDYRMEPYLSYFDSIKDRLPGIFKNYLKSKYSIGSKYLGLQAVLNGIRNCFNVLGYDYSLMDVIDGLPDKIQNEALKEILD